MYDLIRDSTFGTLVNHFSHGRFLPYPEQKPGYQIPSRYLTGSGTSTPSSGLSTRVPTPAPPCPNDEKANDSEGCDNDNAPTPIEIETPIISPHPHPHEHVPEPLPVNHERYHQRVDGPHEKDVSELELGPPIDEEKEKLDPYLVDWEGDDDPDNPLNWSFGKRAFVHLGICILTFSVYIGSAIYTASIPNIMEEFGVSSVVGTLGLSLYVLGYGIGPMILSPLQELPSFGRNPVYIITLWIFALLQIPTALAPNIGSLLVLRFLAGFFASPALATGGASVGDIFSDRHVPYAMGLWAMSAVAGPVLGPIIGGFAAQAKGWRWPIWELLWISGFASIFLFFFLPETLGDTILLKRAKRLRELTGNPNLRSMSEIKQAEMTPGDVAIEYLVRPFQLMMEPAVFFINLYVGLAYAIFYLWFEAFPIVFVETYHFGLGISGLPFLGIVVGALVSYIFYATYVYLYLNPKWERQGYLEPEERLSLAVFAGVMIPISLFIFGWSAKASVPWIAPVIGAGIYMPGIYLLFQSALVYLPLSYPDYAASILAGNDFFRSSAAAAFPLFGRPFFLNLGLGPGCSLLAGLAIIMIPFLWLLRKQGARLRASSKYATTLTR